MNLPYNPKLILKGKIMTSSKQQSKWNDWNFINLDEFRETFPEFRQAEVTAIEQIISGQYKEKSLENSHPTVQTVFNTFKNSPETVKKADKWLADLLKKTNVKNHTPITPTVIGPRAKG